MPAKSKHSTPAPAPHANPPGHDWHEDGMLILHCLKANRPQDAEWVAKLREECPWKHSICTETGRRIEPATDHTVAAWAGKSQRVVNGLVRRGLLPKKARNFSVLFMSMAHAR